MFVLYDDEWDDFSLSTILIFLNVLYLLANMHAKNSILLNTKTLITTSTDCLLSIDEHTIIVETDGNVDFKQIDAIRQLLRVVQNNIGLLDMFKRIVNNYK